MEYNNSPNQNWLRLLVSTILINALAGFILQLIGVLK